MRFLLPGATLKFEEGYQEKFSDRLDDYLITSITGHFGVLPTEIGFSAKGGMGSSGHQAGEAEAAEQIGTIPTARWLSEQISNLSYRWLGMPRELEFRLAPSERSNTEEAAKRDDIRKRSAGMTVNEGRADLGLPLIDAPEADMPFLVAGQSVFLFSPDGMIAAGTPTDENGVQTETPVAPVPTEEPKKAEVKKFIRWVRKGNTSKSFNFEHLESTYAEVLNKFVEAGDPDGARWYAERYLGL